MTAIRLSRPVLSGVTTLGFGRRVGVWTQGCTLGCVGCVSQDTWAADGAEHSVDALADEVLRHVRTDELDGMTVSGGEPFEQIDGLIALLAQVRRATSGRAFDILVYSGHTLAELRRSAGADQVLALVDVLVDGRYRSTRPTNLPFRGSDNQQLHRFTELADIRYASADDPTTPRPSLQVVVEDTSVTWVGIPQPGQLEAIRSSLAAKGIELGGTSW